MPHLLLRPLIITSPYWIYEKLKYLESFLDFRLPYGRGHKTQTFRRSAELAMKG